MHTDQKEIDEVVRKIRDFHRIGRESLRGRPREGGSATGAVREEASKYGLNPDTLRKARTFADENDGYSVAEVNKLCASIRTKWKAFTLNGATIGRTHLLRLLNVPKAKDHRAKVQELMFQNGWSTAELEREIRRRLGRRKRGGRRADIGTNLHELLGHLDLLCESWRRFNRQLVQRQEDGVRPSFGELPDRIRALVVQISERMEKLGDEIDARPRSRSTACG